MILPTYADVLAAEPIVHRYLRPTPLIEWPSLSQLLDCRFFLKHENHLPTTAFKVRGGVHLVSKLTDAQRKHGILGCTTGNHGQSLAYASRLFGGRCILVVPRTANPDKLAAMRALGAEIVEHGRDFDEAMDQCELLHRQEGYRYVHSANEPDLIAGVGTAALEILEDLPDPDMVLVPVGLGSGICGTSLVMAERSPGTRIVGVQAEGAPAITRSWQTGTDVETPEINTFAEGMATRRPASLTIQLIRRHVHEMVLVSDSQLRESIGILLKQTHNLAEGAGAATLAAAITMRDRLAGKKVVAILSGGNLDLRELAKIG